MQVRLMVDSPDELSSLRNWLANEPALRIDEEWEAGPSGAMSATAVLSLVLGSGISIAQLLTTIMIWRASRPKPALLRIQVGNRTVEVTSEVSDLGALAAQLEASVAAESEAD